jgi:hypothetical protein
MNGPEVASSIVAENINSKAEYRNWREQIEAL